MIYKIRFYDSDHGGMRTELTKTINFRGTYRQACMFVESKKSPWGFYYRVEKHERHGVAVITKISYKIDFLENKILELQKELKGEYDRTRDN